MEPKSFNANEILLSNLPKTPEPTPEPKVEAKVEPEAPSNAPAKVEPQTPATPEVVATIDDWDSSEPVKTESPKTEPKAPEQPKPPVDELAGLDERLRKAVDVAKKGGDYLTYLGIQKVDYTKIDPVTLYKESVLSDKSFTPEEAKELLESLTPLQMKERGLQLRSQFVQWQNSQINEFESSLRQSESLKAERKMRADKELQSTLDKVDKIAGLTLKPHHKQDIYDAITTGRMQRELFYNSESGDYDYQSMIETYFVKKNLSKILDHVKKVTASDTLRSHMKEVTNASVDKSKEAPEPSIVEQSNPLIDFVNKSRGAVKK